MLLICYDVQKVQNCFRLFPNSPQVQKWQMWGAYIREPITHSTYVRYLGPHMIAHHPPLYAAADICTCPPKRNFEKVTCRVGWFLSWKYIFWMILWNATQNSIYLNISDLESRQCLNKKEGKRANLYIYIYIYICTRNLGPPKADHK